MKFYMRILIKSVEKLQLSLKSNKTKGTFHEDIRRFMTVSTRIILGMRNVLNKSCVANPDTHFICN